MTDLQTNVLYYGDNLAILRQYLPDASLDLISLDPPFNWNRDYNVIFRGRVGKPVQMRSCWPSRTPGTGAHRPRRPTPT